MSVEVSPARGARSSGSRLARPLVETWLLASGQRRIDLGPGARLIVGRGQDVDLRLDDASVSRRHVLVEWPLDADCPLVEDLGSANGTHVGGIPLTPGAPALVTPGTRLEVGPFELTFLRVGGRGGEPAPAPRARGAQAPVGYHRFQRAPAGPAAAPTGPPDHGAQGPPLADGRRPTPR